MQLLDQELENVWQLGFYSIDILNDSNNKRYCTALVHLIRDCIFSIVAIIQEFVNQSEHLVHASLLTINCHSSESVRVLTDEGIEGNACLGNELI